HRAAEHRRQPAGHIRHPGAPGPGAAAGPGTARVRRRAGADLRRAGRAARGGAPSGPFDRGDRAHRRQPGGRRIAVRALPALGVPAAARPGPRHEPGRADPGRRGHRAAGPCPLPYHRTERPPLTTTTTPGPRSPGRGGPERRGRLAALVRGRPADPRWARPALLALLVLTAAVYTIGLS